MLAWAAPGSALRVAGSALRVAPLLAPLLGCMCPGARVGGESAALPRCLTCTTTWRREAPALTATFAFLSIMLAILVLLG